jgi:tRNA threonylcarbamoyladenosine biosynthesis protein TsaB
MPKALAIETSGRIGSIALADEGQVVSESQFPHGLKHAAEIIPIIDRLCRERHWLPADLQQLYVSAGPGSFTGLRIGITLAKTLAFATGIKLVAVPTVRVLVENAPPNATHAIIVLDAKRDQIYAARFERAGEMWLQREPAHLDSLASMLACCPRPVHLLGDGIPFHEKFIPMDDAGITVTAPDSWPARATVVARIGMELAAAGQFADPYRLTPIYIRLPEAEEKRLAAVTSDSNTTSPR